jgi:predicted nucleotidyltransferase
MVSLKVFNSVGEELQRIEQAYDVRVLYACESGSRAWGFASQDSDYDVRFIYVHNRDWYLSIEDRRDVIEEPISEGLDISGWELRKTLRLLRKSNPPLLEWLKSPVVYAWDEQFVSDFKQLADEYYSPARCFQHYLHLAFGNARDYLKHDQVWFKKYLYVLRPLLACRWIERNMGQVPMLFDELVEGIVEDADVLLAIQNLLARKKAGEELDRGPKDPVLSAYIDAELASLENIQSEDESTPDAEALNHFFQGYCLRSPALALACSG